MSQSHRNQTVWCRVLCRRYIENLQHKTYVRKLPTKDDSLEIKTWTGFNRSQNFMNDIQTNSNPLFLVHILLKSWKLSTVCLNPYCEDLNWSLLHSWLGPIQSCGVVRLLIPTILWWVIIISHEWLNIPTFSLSFKGDVQKDEKFLIKLLVSWAALVLKLKSKPC